MTDEFDREEETREEDFDPKKVKDPLLDIEGEEEVPAEPLEDEFADDATDTEEEDDYGFYESGDETGEYSY